jgi:Ca2+-binding RTX toxin-like protein
MRGWLVARVGLVSLLAATTAVVVAAAPAHAASSSAYVTNDYATGTATLHYSAPPGQVNQVVITQIGDRTFLIDDIVTITAGSGCTRRGTNPDLTNVQCSKADAALKTKLVVDTEDLNDTIDDQVDAAYGATLMGGGGNDWVIIHTSVLGFNNVFGNAGDDIVLALGTTPSAILDGGPGADYMCGAGVHVTVSYKYSPQGVYASANGVVGDDGAPNEKDTICTSVGSIDGSSYTDWLFTSATGGGLWGGGGDDYMSGGAGDDHINGGGDNDVMVGLGGVDILIGNQGNDAMIGGDGNDWLYGWDGWDYLDGEAGSDYLDGGFGPLETDKCVYSSADTYYDCETLV